MIYGYMRVSTQEQKFECQRLLLSKANCDRIICEKQSGVKKREQLDKLLSNLQKDAKLIITRLDRLGRTLKDLINIVELLSRKEVNFISLREGIDTSTSIGRLFFHINAAYAQFEREKLVERTKEGLEAARKMGHKGGRPLGLSDEAKHKAHIAGELYRQYQHDGRYSISELCNMVGVAKSTFYRYIKMEQVYHPL